MSKQKQVKTEKARVDPGSKNETSDLPTDFSKAVGKLIHIRVIKVQTRCQNINSSPV